MRLGSTLLVLFAAGGLGCGHSRDYVIEVPPVDARPALHSVARVAEEMGLESSEGTGTMTVKLDAQSSVTFHVGERRTWMVIDLSGKHSKAEAETLHAASKKQADTIWGRALSAQREVAGTSAPPGPPTMTAKVPSE